MGKMQRLVHLLTQNTGNEENNLIQSLLRNYNLYSLTGHSRIGLALFLWRSGRDVADALNNEPPHTVHMNSKKGDRS